MEPQAPMPADDLPSALSDGLNRLIGQVFEPLAGLLTVEALWLIIGVLVGTHILKVAVRRFVRRGMLDRHELYLINVVLGLGMAWFLWPAAHLVPWWIAGPCWGTGAHWGFRLFQVFLLWRQPQLYARINFDHRRTRQKRPPSRERRRR